MSRSAACGNQQDPARDRRGAIGAQGQTVLGLDLSFPMSVKSGSTTMIGYRDDRQLVPVQLYAVTGVAVSRHRLVSHLGGKSIRHEPKEALGGSGYLQSGFPAGPDVKMALLASFRSLLARCFVLNRAFCRAIRRCKSSSICRQPQWHGATSSRRAINVLSRGTSEIGSSFFPFSPITGSPYLPFNLGKNAIQIRIAPLGQKIRIVQRAPCAVADRFGKALHRVHARTQPKAIRASFGSSTVPATEVLKK